MPKHYIQNAAAGYTPSTFHGAWDDTASAVTRAIGFYPSPVEDMGTPKHSGYLPYVSKAETSTSGTWDVCLLRLVSPPLKANITLSQAITTYLFYTESSTNANFVTHMHVWVTQGDGNLERGVLSADHIGVTEWDTLGNAVFRPDVPAISSVNALAGDRIVIEFGYRATNTVATSYTGLVYYSSSDQLLDGTGIGPATTVRALGAIYNATIEITDAVDYTVPMRITTIQAEVAVQSTDNVAPTRFTSLAIEELVTQLAETRLTQLAVEVLVLPPPSDIVFPEPECIEPARYVINLYDTDGNLKGIIDEPKTFRIEHYLNGYSNCTLPVDDDSQWARLFSLDTVIEIWRRVGSVKYLEYIGLHRTPQRVLTEARHHIHTSFSRGLLDLVNRRCILYKATTKYTLKGGPGETVIKEYVLENVGYKAANTYELDVNGYNIGRLTNGATQGFVVAPDQARGWYYAAQNSWTNVLEVIQEIANISSVDFDVRLTNYKPLEFTFECYYPQLGVDRRSTLKFSPQLGNMAEPSYTYSRTEESNVIAVLGQGEGVHRRTLVQTSGAINDSPWNKCESTTDASGKDRYADYVSSGQAALKERAAVESFEYKILQTSTAQYGIHYRVGDIATFEFSTISRVKKIVGAIIDCADGVETIEVQVGDIPVKPT